MSKRPKIGGDVAQPPAEQRIVESQDDDSEEESDMGMDVDTIHSRTEGLASDPSTSHVKFVVPGIYASEMVVGSSTLTEHSYFDREINDSFPLGKGKFRDDVLPAVLATIAGQNNVQISLGEASGLIKDNTWLRDLLIAFRKNGSFGDIRRLSECLLYTFPVNKFS